MAVLSQPDRPAKGGAGRIAPAMSIKAWPMSRSFPMARRTPRGVSSPAIDGRDGWF